jgi:O-antigen/teichoic acid export membrane protein
MARASIRGHLRGSAGIAVAMGVMNVSTYAFTILAARLLGPVEYGAVAAVMGLLLVLNVLSLGLQATAARRVAARPGDRAEIEHEVMRATYLSAAVLGLLSLAATPLVAAVLNLDSWTAAALLAVTVVPLTVMGGQAGVLQGERRWGALAGVYLGVGLGRLVLGAAVLLVRPDTTGALIGVAAGAVAPVVVGWLALRRPDVEAPAPADSEVASAPARGVLHETFHNSHALLAFFALSNVDVVIARVVLDEHQAGLYAAGLILTKAVLFLPQFVVVIVFPSMSSASSARRMNLQALGLVFGIGAATVLGAAVLSGLAVTFVGGPEYVEVENDLWAFAGLGTLLALLQLMVYNLVARQRQRRVYAIWGALLLVVALAPLLTSVTTLLSAVLAVDGTLFLLLLVRAGLRRQEPQPVAHSSS